MSRRRKIDMTNVESFVRCTEGEHIAKLVEVQENTTQAGDDMLTCVFEVIKGSSKGARVYDNFVLTDKALWKLKQLLQAFGIKADGKIVLDLDKLVGKICNITVYHEEYNGKTKARIDEYTVIESANDEEDEDFDEDEDEEVEEEKPAKKPAKSAKPKTKKKPEPEEEEDDDDWDEDDDEEEDTPKKPVKKPTKKATNPNNKKKATTKKPEPEDDDEDWDDDDDWEED